MNRGCTLMQINVSLELVRAAYRRSLRNGLYFKLNPEERAILKISALYLSRIRSLTLREILSKIILKVWPSLAFKVRVLEVGFKLLKKRVETALRLGYSRAREWLNDVNLAFYLGLTWVNTSPILRPPL